MLFTLICSNTILFTLTLLSVLFKDVVGSLAFLTVQKNPSQREYPQSSFNRRVEKGDSPSKLVRIQRRVSRKRYLHSKRTYEYERVSLHIPKKYHELIRPFLNQDFDVSVTAAKDIIIITLTPQKPVQKATNSSYKTALEVRPET